MISINKCAVSLFATGENTLSAGPNLGIWSLNKTVCTKVTGACVCLVSRVSVGAAQVAGRENRNAGGRVDWASLP